MGGWVVGLPGRKCKDILTGRPRDSSDHLGRRGGRHRLRHQSASRAGRHRRAAQGRPGEGAGHAGALPRRGSVVEAAADPGRGAELEVVVLVDLAHHVPDAEDRTAGFLQGREEETLCGNRPFAAGSKCTILREHRSAADGPPDQRARDRAGRSILVLLHRRHHGHAEDRHAHARERGRQCMEHGPGSLAMAIDASKAIFCGLPLFHVNAVLVTGLLPFSRGAHVILGTPQGYRGDGCGAPLLGAGREAQDQLLQRRSDAVRGAPSAADAGTRHPVAAVRTVRRGSDAGRVDAQLPGKDGTEDPRGLWPHRGRLRQHLQSSSWRTPPRLDRTAHPAAADEGRGAGRLGRVRARLRHGEVGVW